MAKPFKNLIKKMSPKSRQNAKEKTARLVKEIALRDLRENKKLLRKI